MKVLHLLAAGGTGGIEVLCKDILLKSDLDNRICCLFDEGEIFRSLKEENKNIFSLKKDNGNLKKMADDLTKYCIDEKIDIVTVHHGGLKCNLIYIMLKKRLPDLKYVRYLHGCFDKYTFGNDKGILNRVLIKIIMQKAFDCSDLLIFISKAVEKSFEIKFNIKNKNKAIIYNGIDEKFFCEQKIKENEEGITNIIFVGRLSYVKGVDILIKAFNEVEKKNDNVSLTIVGDGEEREKLIELSEKLEIRDKVKFVGRQYNVIEWLDKSDIFVYPSIWEEGFGISVVEAMARGCIPITFNKGGLIEIIKNEENGFLINQINYKKLAQVIDMTIKNKNKEIIRKNAISTATKFNVNNTIDQIEVEYIKITGDK